MKIVYGVSKIDSPAKPSAVTVGIFDGVHIGHRRIIRKLVGEAASTDILPVIVTFQPHPLRVLKGNLGVAMLCSLQHRLRLLKTLGVKACVVMKFNKSFAKMKAKDFFKKILIDKLNMRILVIGKNFSFGREGLSGIKALKSLATSLNFTLKIVKPKRYHNRVISSSLIRHLIEDGRLNMASQLLGRPVSVLGTVVKGKGRGRIIGFKTANVDPHHEAIPPSGVYAAYCRIGKYIYRSVLNIGTRPTFGEKEPTIEAHVFGLSRNVYGENIEIYFKKRLRQERRFKNKEHLRRQILRDAAQAKKIL
jgi:riboflavin kinase/FMN adenylyltransferase